MAGAQRGFADNKYDDNQSPCPGDLDRLVAAFVRIRGVDRLEGAIMTRHWLAADMRISMDRLDRLLKLLRWQRLIDLPNAHLITVVDPAAMRALALEGCASVVLARETAEKGKVDSRPRASVADRFICC